MPPHFFFSSLCWYALILTGFFYEWTFFFTFLFHPLAHRQSCMESVTFYPTRSFTFLHSRFYCCVLILIPFLLLQSTPYPNVLSDPPDSSTTIFQPQLGIIIIIIDPTHRLKIFPSPRYTYTQIYLRTKRFDFFLLDIAFSTWTFFFLWMFVSHSHSLLMFLYIGHSGMIKFEIT